MDPATLAASVISILTPYVTKGAKELIETVGEVAYEHAKKLFNTLKTRWSADPVASDSLTRFEKKPEIHSPALQEIVEERLKTDPQLSQEVSQTVKDIGPKLDILVKLTKGQDVTGLDAGNIKRGDVKVTLDIGDGTNIVGARIKDLG
jgi:hypothetical protein